MMEIVAHIKIGVPRGTLSRVLVGTSFICLNLVYAGSAGLTLNVSSFRTETVPGLAPRGLVT